MAKVQRLITLTQEINERLSRVQNASALIEHLLEDHFAMRVIHEANMEELQGQETKLKDQLKELQTKREVINNKEVLFAKLREIGIVNEHLIQQLIEMKVKPTVHTVKHLKETYNLNSSLLVWNAWDIIHGKEEEETKDATAKTMQ